MGALSFSPGTEHFRTRPLISEKFDSKPSGGSETQFYTFRPEKIVFTSPRTIDWENPLTKKFSNKPIPTSRVF